jgi:Flp pilus assembly protein TadG
MERKGARRRSKSQKKKERSMKKRINMLKLLRLAREERGFELVEFAITGWLLILLLIGAFECAYAMYAYHYTTYAAQEGARFASVRGHTWSKYETVNCGTSAPPNFTMAYNCTALSSDIQNYVQSLATGGINVSGVAVTGETSGTTVGAPIWPGATPDCTSSCSLCSSYANSQGCMVKVTVTYTFNVLPFLHMHALSMSSTSENVILQ